MSHLHDCNIFISWNILVIPMSSNGKGKILIIRSHCVISYAEWNSAIKLRATVIYLWTNTTVVFILTACGRRINWRRDHSSPFYPNVYPGERVYVWTIRQPQSQVVLLNFTAFIHGGSASTVIQIISRWE